MSIQAKRPRVLYVDAFSTAQARNNTAGLCAAYEEIAALRTFDYRNIAKNRGVSVMNFMLASLASTFKPSLIHLGKCETVRPSTIKKIKQDIDTGIIHLYGDYRPRPPRIAIELGTVVDCLFLQCNDNAFFNVFRAQGVKNIEPFTSGTDTEMMYLEGVEKVFDVVFFGNRQVLLQGHRFRNRVIDYLRANSVNLHIFGNKWPEHKKNHPFVSVHRFRRIANHARINLAIGGMFHVNECTSWPRVFNPMACGTFTLCKRFKGVENILEPGKHIVLFDTPEECLALVQEYLENSAKRGRIAKEGAEFVKANYSWDKVVQQFMRYAR